MQSVACYAYPLLLHVKITVGLLLSILHLDASPRFACNTLADAVTL